MTMSPVTVEYTDYISVEGLNSSNKYPRYDKTIWW